MAGKINIEQQVSEWLQPILDELGLELVDVEWLKEGGAWYLRIFVDKEEGIDLDDCQEVSRRLDEILEREDPVPQAYSLEVSSPGIERPLKKDRDFERFAGSAVRITTFVPIGNTKEHIGNLIAKTDEGIRIEQKGGELLIPLAQVASARLYVQF
ncbi:ribosome maturation factor RimP [Heliophilum fasciatum]|uniref:Ribosome maturation factor RimP n=1 Tax=Heliophilum fasciatum TaxID=35700 RepID=A0A4R2RX09_9FIRM|nr:ribosome maturation factor RimP [Heliophilum fasciatum]MCW2277899.1 ribosome maturation factor RimP [Heliophilum fasciatum]TCP64531.1 ribosome maturation factor RimP [Heliophilum fasciatum]